MRPLTYPGTRYLADVPFECFVEVLGGNADGTPSAAALHLEPGTLPRQHGLGVFHTPTGWAVEFAHYTAGQSERVGEGFSTYREALAFAFAFALTLTVDPLALPA